MEENRDFDGTMEIVQDAEKHKDAEEENINTDGNMEILEAADKHRDAETVDQNGDAASNMEIIQDSDDVTSKDAEKDTTSSVKSSVSARRQRILSLPLSRVKQIMKIDPEVHMASSESVFLLAKCAEIFIEMLTKEAYTSTVQSKKKTIQKRDVDTAIGSTEQLSFLDATLD